MRITNHARARRTVELTTYSEVVLAPPVADAIQPSFGKLFVQTEIIRARRAILCTRRPRSAGEHVPWSFQLLAARAAEVTDVSYETDRMRFIGRGRTVAAPLALDDDRRAFRHRGLGAGPDRLDPLPRRARAGRVGDARLRVAAPAAAAKPASG